MRTGLSLSQLASEIQYQEENKKDFLVNTTAMQVIPPDEKGTMGIAFRVPGKKKFEYEISRHMLTQISGHTKVPMTLVNILAQGSARERDQLGQLLTVRLQENESVRMVRTMGRFLDDPYARAFLSERYRTIDNYDLSQAILPVVNELDKPVKIVSCDITEIKLYIKMVYSHMSVDIGPTLDKAGKKVGDVMQAGVVISNSEVGAGSLSVEPFILRLVCSNGMIARDNSIRRTHIGRSNLNGDTELESAYELYSTETRILDDAALFSKVRDTVKAVLTDEKSFLNITAKLTASKEDKLTGHPQAAITELAKKYTLSVDESQNVLKHLIEGNDISKFGVINAVTAFARDPRKRLSYDRVTELESVGGRILELPKSEWKTIATAVVPEKK